MRNVFRQSLALWVVVGLMSSVLLLGGCRDKGDRESAAGGSGASGGAVFSSDGVSIHYKTQGKGKPALVFVHGWSCDSSYWDGQVRHFGKEYKVVTVDLAGHGESGLDRAEWTIEAFGRDVASVVKQLELDEVILVGHSMGGDVIVEAVKELRGRVGGLVFVDSFRNLRRLSEEQIQQIVGPFRKDFEGATSRFVRRLFAPMSDQGLVDEVVKDMSSGHREVGLALLGALYRWRSKKLVDGIEGAGVPIISISSDMRAIDREAFEGRFESFKFVIVSGVGHFLMMEDVEGFNEVLGEAVKELAAGG